VVAFDTNVLVRVLIGDDPAQTRVAERAFLRHARGDGVFVSLVVLAEIAWVLRAGYGLGRTSIHERLAKLMRTRGVIVEAGELVEEALDRYRHGKAELADYLILGKSRSANALPLLTFDRKLARERGARLL
jgi:predicted nucleic-acid-binding protein